MSRYDDLHTIVWDSDDIRKSWEECKEEPAPVMGMGATVHIGSDDYPYTIVEAFGKCIVIQPDRTTKTPQMFERDITGKRLLCRKVKRGGREVWRVSKTNGGTPQEQGGCYVSIGYRCSYFDPSF